MKFLRTVKKAFSLVLALSLLPLGPAVAADQPGRAAPSTAAALTAGKVVPGIPVDFRAAVRVCVLEETGVATPFSGTPDAIHDGVGKARPAISTDSAAGTQNPWATGTVPPNSPRTTRSHKVAAYTALAILAAASAVLVAREVHRDNPVLTAGTPTRVP